MLLLTVAINRDGKVAGHAVDEVIHPQQSKEMETERKLSDGSIVVSSVDIAKDISGYGGTTPVNVYISNGVISKIELLENNETPDFLNTVVSAGLTESWTGLKIDEALSKDIDAVSGATMTSQSLIATIKRTLEYASGNSVTSSSEEIALKSIIGILVILTGILLSFFAKSGVWRVIQLMLNVIVLGFWCGNFLSLSLFVNWLSNDVNIIVMIVPFLLLLSAVIMPFVGQKGHYCAWHCPFGSLQELAGNCRKRKIVIPQFMLKYLNYLRDSLLLGLLMLMWLGVGFSWIDYELFPAFLFRSASIGIVIAALLFIILSIFIKRPYCRFICPTGALLKFSSKTKIG